MIYQINEKHGRHISYSKQEAEANEKHGWKTVTEAEFNIGWIYPKTETEIITDDFESRYERALGKKPDKRKKRETLEDELNANRPGTD